MQQSLDNILISISHTHTRAPSVIHFKKIICLANSDNNNHLNWTSNRNWITMMANERNLNEECVCALLQNWNVSHMLLWWLLLLSVTDSDYITLIISESAFLWKPWSWKKNKTEKICVLHSKAFYRQNHVPLFNICRILNDLDVNFNRDIQNQSRLINLNI